MKNITQCLAVSAILLAVVPQTLAQNTTLTAALDKLLADGEIVAAQAVVGHGDNVQVFNGHRHSQIRGSSRHSGSARRGTDHEAEHLEGFEEVQKTKGS